MGRGECFSYSTCEIQLLNVGVATVLTIQQENIGDARELQYSVLSKHLPAANITLQWRNLAAGTSLLKWSQSTPPVRAHVTAARPLIRRMKTHCISVTFLPQLHDLNLFIRPKLRDILHGKGPVIYKSIKAAKVKTDRRHLVRGELKREDS